MSTKGSTKEDDLLYYDTYAPIYFKGTEHLIPIFRPHVEKGIIQIESFMEQCLAIASDGMYSVDSIDGRDFTDGSDSKKVTTRTHSYDRQHGAKVPDHKTKHGLLRVTVLHKLTRKFHFFAIPKIVHVLYEEVNLNFHFNGGIKSTDLRRSNAIADLSVFEVESFQRLATITDEEAIELGKNAIKKNASTYFSRFRFDEISDDDLDFLPIDEIDVIDEENIQLLPISFDDFFTEDNQ